MSEEHSSQASQPIETETAPIDPEERPGTGDLDEMRGDVIASLDERNRAWTDLMERGDQLDDVERELGRRVAEKSD